jgi:predicted enzyme related to lactoylglutathione lyase
MNRIVHFEIQADDVERAATFYREVFGWTIEKWGSLDMDYWMVMTAPKESTEPGINGGLLKRPAKTPPHECGVNAFVCTVQVENFDETAQKIEKAGGIVAMPKFAIGGMAWQGYFVDTEGNTFGVHQADPNAK